MKALIATGTADLVEFAEVSAPSPGSGELLVAVEAFSINRGELRRLQRADRAWRPGWDVVGRIIEVGDPSSEFRAGARVFGIATGGSWAEQVVVRTDRIAHVPASLEPALAAALPTAGITALRTLALGAPLRDRRVLITGAAGGVGHLAMQIAHREGGMVTGVIGRADRVRDVMRGRAWEWVVGIQEATGGFDLILESAGGASFARALTLVTPHGMIVSFGMSAASRSTIDVGAFYPKQATLQGYWLPDDVIERPPTDDLAHLADAVLAGQLLVDVAMVAAWDQTAAALRSMRGRRLGGKAVLLVGDPAMTR